MGSEMCIRDSIAVCCCAVFFFFSLACSNTHAQYAGAQAVPEEWKTGFDSINQAQAKEWLAEIASPQVKGRGTGQPGYSIAAKFVAKKLNEFGIQPKGDRGTFFQNLPMTRRVPIIEECRILGAGFQVPGQGTWGLSAIRLTAKWRVRRCCWYLEKTVRICPPN